MFLNHTHIRTVHVLWGCYLIAVLWGRYLIAVFRGLSPTLYIVRQICKVLWGAKKEAYQYCGARDVSIVGLEMLVLWVRDVSIVRQMCKVLWGAKNETCQYCGLGMLVLWG